jgi:hypothetical protein
MRTKILRAALLAAALLLAACGGGGGSDPSAPAGASPVVTVGAISGFGSVHVNGIRFETNGAVVTLDGQPGTEAQLRVGQVVRIRGTRNGAGDDCHASSIDFDDAVQGPVEAVDATAGTLVVLGQGVRVDELTSFDDRFEPASLAGVAVGAIVEVSGFRDAGGVIHATRIEPKDAGELFEVTGTVANHDAAARRFDIAALTVDYSAAQLDDLPGGAPDNGLLVEVKGRTLAADGVLLATRVEGKRDDMDDDDDMEAEIEGVITRFASASDFDVSGHPVSTTSTTRFENGSSDDLALGVRVEVEGDIRNGVLVAEKVKFEREADLRVSAGIDAIDAAAGTFSVLGITVQTNATTRFEDKTDAQVRPFGVGDLRVGDFVEVRGSAGSVPDSIAAARVEREDAEERLELRGIAEDVAEPQLSILGVTVLTNANTEFEDEGDDNLGAAEFFARAPGRLVSVDGQLEGDVFVAREIELEGDDDSDD